MMEVVVRMVPALTAVATQQSPGSVGGGGLSKLNHNSKVFSIREPHFSLLATANFYSSERVNRNHDDDDDR